MGDFDIGVLQKADICLFCAGRNPKLLSALWPHMTNLKWLHCYFAGVNHLLFPELRGSSVPMTNARGVYSGSLAEWVLFACMWFAKDVNRMRSSQLAGKWDKFPVETLTGRTFGVVGYGDIGRSCAKLARAFGMRVLALKRNASAPLSQADGAVERVYEPREIAQLMANSDYVCVAAPLTEETRGLVSAEAIAAMKPTGVLINIGRGPVVEEKALIAALQEKRIRGAALDVFATEPLPEGHPFYKLENVLMTPHNVDNTSTAHHESMEFFLENAIEFVAGRPLLSLVDKQAGY